MPSFYPSEKEEKNDQKSILPLTDDISKKSWQEFWKTGIPSYLNLLLIPFGWRIAARRDKNGEVIAVYPVRTSIRETKDSGINRTIHTFGKYLQKNSHLLYNESYKDDEEVFEIDPSMFEMKELDDFNIPDLNDPNPENIEAINSLNGTIDISDLK